MPSLDERREVAARLRSVEADAYSCCETYYDALRDAVGCGYGQDRQYMDFGERLADLIEPEPERTCLPAYDGRYNNAPKCSICGEILSASPMIRVNYCGGCGARVIGG